MALKTTIDPEIHVDLSDARGWLAHFGPRDELRKQASQIIQETWKDKQREAGHSLPLPVIKVDGHDDDLLLRSVQPDSTIEAIFEPLTEVPIAWIMDQLERHSPTGGPPEPTYAKAHVLYVDGYRANPAKPPRGVEYVIINTTPYARKIERGVSQAAPEGVYQVVAVLAQQKFRDVQIRYEFRKFPDLDLGGGGRFATDTRNPAIVIRVPTRGAASILGVR